MIATATQPATESAGTKAAYGERNVHAIKARHQAYRGLKLLGSRPPGDVPDHVEFAPAARNAAEYSDLCTRVSSYLADVDLPFYLPGPRFPVDPGAVPYMDPSLVRDPGWVAERPGHRPYLVVHRLTPQTLAQVASHRGAGATVVDGRLYFLHEMSYWRVRDSLAWPNYPLAEESLRRIRARTEGATSAFVLVTGPSALTVDLAAVTADVRITCNSAIRDAERMKAFRPTVIAFTDPVFHLGPSRYAATFRQDVLRALEICDEPLLLCGSDWVSPLLTMLPELEPHLAVLPIGRGGSWRWPTDRNPTVRSTGSVFSALMLPFAFAVADHVSVAGADGRKPTEKYFWTHGLQYSDELMQTVFDAHPAFFRDRDYADHYENYIAELEGFFQTAEAAGKTVVGAAPSWIPALRKRGAQEPA